MRDLETDLKVSLKLVLQRNMIFLKLLKDGFGPAHIHAKMVIIIVCLLTTNNVYSCLGLWKK